MIGGDRYISKSMTNAYFPLGWYLELKDEYI
jgi:hypothetical protein